MATRRALVTGNLLVATVLLTVRAFPESQSGEIDLSGTWRFALDREDGGVAKGWFRGKLEDSVRLPGSLQAQGKGDDVSVDTSWTGDIVDRSWFTDARYAEDRVPGKIRVPFWLQPDKHYVGPAWYQRDVEVPEGWKGERILLSLERCHWETRVWVNGKEAGSADSLSTPHVHDLTGFLSPGRHILTVRVDNRVKIGVGLNAHSVSDHTQTNWNGIVGEMKLVAKDLIGIDDIQVFPDVKRKKAAARIRIGNASGAGARARLRLSARSFNSSGSHAPPELTKDCEIGDKGSVVDVEYPMGPEARLWDEFSPALYRLEVRLDGGVRFSDSRSVVFGMREIGTEGTQFTVNGRRIFLRGTLECCIFPLTGYPPTDADSWKRILRVAKAHGLNHIRFHSWCPPRAAFTAADELGFYFYVECAAWASIGDGKPIDRWIFAESDRILEEYGNHPSFALLSYGNEPGGAHQNRYLGDLVDYWKKKDARRLYTSGAGWPALPENQFHVTPSPRIQQWGEGIGSRINVRPPETCTDYRDLVEKYKVPVVSHEIGQWCVYPNFDEIPKYKGVLKAKNFEIFRDSLEEAGMGDRARDFLMASGKLQAICYKEEIESALRTPGMGGFELLDLHDFPGQGTALVGVLDPFWESKGYISPQGYRRFCGNTVPLARMTKRIWTGDEKLSARIEVANFGPGAIENAVASWTILDAAGKPVASGALPARSIPVGSPIPLGDVSLDLKGLPAPAKYTLAVALVGTAIENDWDIWVYPSHVDVSTPDGILVSERLDDEARARLGAGGKVLLLPGPKRIRTNVVIGFSSIFWNTAWTGNQPPHTLGILCDPKHPALAEFPTEYHSNWQWWEIVSRSAAMVLDGVEVLGADGKRMDGSHVNPMVQVIDTWFENRRLGLVFEAKVLGGKLLVASIDLRSDLDSRPVARQMLRSLIDYMVGPRFDPSVVVSADSVAALIREPSRFERLGARVLRADSEADGLPGAHAIDGDPDRIWHTSWSPQPSPMPHSIVIDLQKSIRLEGITYLPRQDMSNGRIAKYSIYLGDDPDGWGSPLATGTWPDSRALQTVRFDKPAVGRYLKLEALSEVRGNAFTSVAEIDVITE